MTVDRVAARIVRVDPAFAPIVKAAGPVALREPMADAFNALLRAIVFQQLAGRAASAIHGRVVALFNGELASPETLLALSADQLRSAGLSASKQAALIDLATKFNDGTVPVHDVDQLSDDEIVERLIAVRGVGRWTAEMFLIFQLRRPDVWPVDDFAVRAGWARIHKLELPPKPKELLSLGDVFRPHRSAAAWYCWRATDTVLPD
ncbi:MAG TPA: DNA-3-methyladenine glycosylase 2 family protein [Candidatus Dormibacteraeota bacterium]|nr:DNA-3-methyladenine glycosylase 2 family protein [Candidatus Dormibacteraeota bacterium]